ncbi:hypothetical protein NSQ59_27220 [Margalitia sp. FSL K6-0131]|uniref:hypothetical protein n=1 Tax=Margalitia sp. FSL K6-0131 TaxID=2954604 RepID=UPI0030FCC950
MENLNPIFEMKIPKKISEKTKPRKTRNDKKHPIKFPVNENIQMKFRQSLIRFKRIYPHVQMTQTVYNTLLLSYALSNESIINWTMPYKGSKLYMTTKILEEVYRQTIGGENGLTIRKGLTDSKVAYYLTVSALLYIEKRGLYSEILQQAKYY